MKKFIFITLTALLACSCGYNRQGLNFNPKNGVEAELTMPDGQVVKYTAYERLFYVRNVEDSAYQYMNIYVPEGATKQSPIFLRTYVGGYMAAKARHRLATPPAGRCAKDMWWPFPARADATPCKTASIPDVPRKACLT